MSTAILSFKARLVVTPYDSSGVLSGSSYTIQAADCTVEGTTNLQDFTNFESNGYAEFAPTYVISNVAVNDGILDSTGLDGGDFYLGVYSQLQNKLMTKIDFYLLKSAGGNNPQKITATKAIFEKASVKADVKQGVDRVSFSARVIGAVTVSGTDVQAISGYIV